MSRAVRVVLCGMAATAATLGWFAFRGDPRASPPAAAIQGRTAPSDSGAPPAEDLSLAPRPESETEAEIAQADRVVVSDASNVARRVEASVILKGHIESSRTDLERALVSVQGEPTVEWNITPGIPGRRNSSSGSDTSQVRAEVLHDGTFELDVTTLARDVKNLRVIAKHPNLKPRVELVATRPATASNSRERVELHVELKMFEAACTVRGRIIAPGDSRAIVAVTAFVVQDGEVAVGSSEAIECDRQGNFETTTVAGVERVLLAQADAWYPATIRVHCAGDEPIELGTIELERGVSISGQVLLGTAPFGTGMYVSAQLGHAPTWVSVNGSSFVWSGDHFDWAWRTTRAGDLGLYELTGLGPYTYSVRVEDLDGFSPVQALNTLSVLAPATDVELAPKVCELRVAIFEAGAPVRVDFTIRQRFGSDGVYYVHHTTDDNGRATVWLVPGRTSEVVIRSDTPRERDYAVPACEVNGVTEMRIDM